MCHQEIKIRPHSPPLDTTKVHPYLNVIFDTTPYQLHISHEMAPIFPRDPLFQKNYHKDRGREITSVNLGPYDINHTKIYNFKKLFPLLDATQSMHIIEAELGGTVENYAIGGKRNFRS